MASRNGNSSGALFTQAIRHNNSPFLSPSFHLSITFTTTTITAICTGGKALCDGDFPKLVFYYLGGWAGTSTAGLYCASKAVVAIYTEALRRELADFGIETTCIEPRYFRTNFLSGGHKVVAQKHIPALEKMTEVTRAALAAYNYRQPGDPVKGAKVIVEILTKTGGAERHSLPARLALGRDVLDLIGQALKREQEELERWQDLTATTDYDDIIKVAVKNILAIHGTVDIVVNNLEEVTPEETLQQFQANNFGPLNVCRAFLPHLREKDSGKLVTIGPMATWYPMPGCNLYDSSKAAVRWIAIGLQGEVEQFGIKHCLVEPGFFRTELLSPTANIATTNSTARLPAYAELNATTDGNFAAFNGSQLDNPVKGADIMYDVITSSGVAKGRELPEFLPLGSDACEEISKVASKTIAAVEEWRGISSLSDFSAGQ